MTPTTHDRFAEMAAAYALDALDATDRQAFEAHLASCAECRREAYNAWRAAWAQAEGLAVPPLADAMDRVLHPARIDPATRRQRVVPHPAADLPDGAMVALPDDPGGAWLVLGHGSRRWSPSGYGEGRARPSGPVGLLTPLPRATGKEDRAGRNADHADIVRRELLRERLRQAGFSRLDGVVGHPAA